VIAVVLNIFFGEEETMTDLYNVQV